MPLPDEARSTFCCRRTGARRDAFYGATSNTTPQPSAVRVGQPPPPWDVVPNSEPSGLTSTVADGLLPSALPVKTCSLEKVQVVRPDAGGASLNASPKPADAPLSVVPY